jgi:hypothetical protein
LLDQPLAPVVAIALVVGSVDGDVVERRSVGSSAGVAVLPASPSLPAQNKSIPISLRSSARAEADAGRE